MLVLVLEEWGRWMAPARDELVVHPGLQQPLILRMSRSSSLPATWDALPMAVVPRGECIPIIVTFSTCSYSLVCGSREPGQAGQTIKTMIRLWD